MTNHAKLKIGEFVLDPSRNLLIGGDREVALEPKVVDVLVALAAQPGTVLSRDALIDAVWKTEFGADERLTRAISQLRKAFGDERGTARYIETVSKRGYRLVADVEPAGDGNGTTASVATLPLPSPAAVSDGAQLPPVWSSRSWRAYAVAGFAVVLAAVGFAAAVGRYPPSSTSAYMQDVVELRHFVLIDAKPGMETFARQVHASAKRILASNQVLVIEASDRDGPAAESKNSEFILAGTIEQSGDRYAVTLYFDSREDGQTLWSQQFARAAADVEGLREEIGANAAYVIACSLKQRSVAREKPSTPAFKIYLEICDPRHPDESDKLASAHRLIALAPNDAYGHALAAVVNAMIATNPSELSETQIEAYKSAARKAADLSLALDPESPHAHFALAIIAPAAEHWMALETFAQRVGKQHPAINGTGIYIASLRSSGRLKEALHLTKQRVARSPLSVWANVVAAFLNMQMGNHEEADRLLGEALRISPDDPSAHWYRFINAAFYGDIATASTLLNHKSPALDLDRAGRECMQTFIDARRRGGPPDERAALRKACDGHTGTDYVVRMMAALGDIDAAYAAARGIPINAGGGTNFLFYPEMAPFRRDPRFMPLIAKSGLLEFWIESGRWPDFCSDKALPYDCETAAARALQDKVAGGGAMASPQ